MTSKSTDVTDFFQKCKTAEDWKKCVETIGLSLGWDATISVFAKPFNPLNPEGPTVGFVANLPPKPDTIIVVSHIGRLEDAEDKVLRDIQFGFKGPELDLCVRNGNPRLFFQNIAIDLAEFLEKFELGYVYRCETLIMEDE